MGDDPSQGGGKVKATHTKLTDKSDHHQVVLEGRAEEFEKVIDSFTNHPDDRIQKLATYLRKSIGTGRT
jgi:hypothetical protein